MIGATRRFLRHIQIGLFYLFTVTAFSEVEIHKIDPNGPFSKKLD
jgi:hypothetical protein